MAGLVDTERKDALWPRHALGHLEPGITGTGKHLCCKKIMKQGRKFHPRWKWKLESWKIKIDKTDV